MCGPAALPLLAVAATAVTATGQIMQGAQAKAQGNYEAKVAEQNASLVRNQQETAIAKATADRVQLDRKYAAVKGQQQAAFGANGIDANFGSAAMVADDTTRARNLDASTLYLNEKDELSGLDIQAANYGSQAQSARMRGSAAMTNSLFAAGGTVLSGAQQFAKLKAGR